MIDRSRLKAELSRLARAAPGAFRNDPVFQAAAIGALLALAFLVVRLGGRPGAVPGAVPAPPPPPASLGASYGQGGAATTPSATTPAPASGEPITPSRSLTGVVVQPGTSTPADRFGTLEAAKPKRKDPDARP